MKILLDMDGVIVDFVTGYFNLINKPLAIGGWKPGVWDIEAGTGTKMDEELLSVNFWSSLPWMPDGLEILRTLESFFGVENICILSSCHVKKVGDACAGKINWINKHLPAYGEHYLFGPNKSFCSHRDSILIDDRDKNVDDFRKQGGRAILIPRVWNTAHPRWAYPQFHMRSYLVGQLDAIRS